MKSRGGEEGKHGALNFKSSEGSFGEALVTMARYNLSSRGNDEGGGKKEVNKLTPAFAPSHDQI